MSPLYHPTMINTRNKTRWAKGNLHTHTTRSDGDSPPEHVADWYQAHGYDFLCLSDHDHLTVLEAPASAQSRWPLLIRGQEVTSRANNIHLNGYGLGREVQAADGLSVVETIQTNVNRIREAGGLPAINHPNYKWAVSANDLLRVEGLAFMEVFNGHTGANNAGGGGRPGHAAIWDRLLSAGKRVWGIAVDDAHHFQEEFAFERANPGRGWVQVNTPKLTEEAVLAAMAAGDFYATTGVTLGELRSSREEVVLEIDPEPDALYTTTFTGHGGNELHVADGLSPRYRPSRLDTFVRASVRSSRGTFAWTQPVFMDQGTSAGKGPARKG